MLSSRANSAVRGLRAMFENNESTSPELRGRSPAGSVTSNGEGHTLNTVRTSFIPVEPIGSTTSQMPSKEGSGHPLDSETDRKGSFDSSMEKELDSVAGDNADSSSDMVDQKGFTPAKAAAASNVIEGVPADTSTSKREQEGNGDKQVDDMVNGMKSMTLPSEDVPSSQPDKMTSSIEDEDAAMRPSDPKDKKAVSGGEALPPPAEPLTDLSHHTEIRSSSSTSVNGTATNDLEGSGPAAMQNGHTVNGAPTTSSSSMKNSPKKSKPTPGRSQAVSTGRRTSPKKEAPASLAAAAPKSPITPTKPSNTRTQATPTSSSTAAMRNGTPSSSADATANTGHISPTSSKPATKTTNGKPPRTSLTAPTAASLSKVSKPRLSSASATSTASKKPARSPPASSAHPKSPTRPIRVSSHLTAPTAASAAKHGTASGTATATTASSSIARKPSTLKRDPATASRITKPTASNAAKTVRRPSPPKQNGIKRPESRASRSDNASAPATKEPSKSAGPGFLERMMRPTASSSSKAHEKMESGK